MRSRTNRAILILAGAAPLALLFGAMIHAIATLPGETVSVGRRGGPWHDVPTWQVQAVVLPILLTLAALFLGRLTSTLLRLASNGPGVGTRPTRQHGLALGEAIVWRGRQGWRGLAVSRLVVLALAALGPVVLLLWLHHIWSGTDPLAAKLFWTFGALFVLGGSVAMALVGGPAALRALWRDLFGTMVVTDRRLAWLSPWRQEVYREISGDDLVDAFIVEDGARRGWIALVQRRGADVQEVDVRGVPRPDTAVAALSHLLRSRIDPPPA